MKLCMFCADDLICLFFLMFLYEMKTRYNYLTLKKIKIMILVPTNSMLSVRVGYIQTSAEEI